MHYYFIFYNADGIKIFDQIYLMTNHYNNITVIKLLLKKKHKKYDT